MRRHRREARGAAAVLVAVLLAAGCSGGEPDEVEAAQVTPEPTSDSPPATDEPREQPTSSEEPEPEPTIGEDEPLYAPLPELEPDPDNDVPDDIEQLILDAYADAYNTEFTAYATGELHEADLKVTHFADAFEQVKAYVSDLRADGLVEKSPDTEIQRVWVHDFAGGVAVVRECAVVGERTGRYSAEDGSLAEKGPAGLFALDRRLELVKRTDEDVPRYRVTAAAQAGSDSC